MNLSNLPTEMPNLKSKDLDTKDTIEILKIINEEDAVVTLAIREVLEEINEVVQICLDALKSGGRVFYVGAGTSGRVAFIDAVELVPTYSLASGIFIPIIAGGSNALAQSVEGVEDDEEGAMKDLSVYNPQNNDVVIGIAASGRTPYVAGALRYARKCGCKTALICNVKNPSLAPLADVVVSAETGPEVVAGSTRMKAGSAQKMILNMISTTVMVKMGKVFDNLMVDVMVLNEKLKERARNIVAQITKVKKEVASEYLVKSNYNVKLAILMIMSGKSLQECQMIMQKYPNLREALRSVGEDAFQGS
ncbi:N-acetylmuramic acid 6-phosphate etherase [Pseudothermotoga sp. U03pept]|uniref:N-acetylmuramic acid 6-phosphate etherase n=1 Tax=Pseudothermotoga sp. U03pept TaxID=3447012 RepID=UPI003F0E0B05